MIFSVFSKKRFLAKFKFIILVELTLSLNSYKGFTWWSFRRVIN